MNGRRILTKHTVAELFCGCGGFSHGFHRSGRFRVVFGNDIKKAALRTFRVNHTHAGVAPAVLLGDIREVPATAILDALEARGVGPGALDCLIGGPPCQGFSQMRRSEERSGSAIMRFKGYNRLDHDPRNDLVLRFLEVVDVLRPKMALIENVPQMLKHSHNGQLGGLATEVRELLLEMGYDVAVRRLNAADYGVPQLRERVFFIASRVGPASFPEPTHGDPESLSEALCGIHPWVTVRDAIGDLPEPAPGPTDALGGGPLSLYPNVPLSEYARRMRSAERFPYNHLTRQYSERILRTIREMQPGETWDSASARMQARYDELINSARRRTESRDAALRRLSREGAINSVFYRKYYWSAYTRLAWERPALTITANSNFLGSGRFTHPERDRGITMREAARLQSFEDDFRFITSGEDDEGTYKMGVGLDMIGEAVPPVLAEALARHVATLLDMEPVRQNGHTRKSSPLVNVAPIEAHAAPAPTGPRDSGDGT